MKTSNKKYYIASSKIHGKGVFASDKTPKGTTIGLLHTIIKLGFDYDLSELGKSHNHSKSPNCFNKLINNKRYMVTKRDVAKGEELTTDYTLQPDLEQPSAFISLPDTTCSEDKRSKSS